MSKGTMPHDQRTGATRRCRRHRISDPLFPVELLVENNCSVSAIIGLLSGYMSSGKNQFPRDPSLKDKTS